MLSRLARLLLTLTSLAPVALVYGASQWSIDRTLAVSLFCASVGLWWLCVLLLTYAKRHAESEPLSVSSIRNANHEILTFFVAYLLPLLVPSENNQGATLAIAVFVILLAVIVFRSSMLHVNPLMGIIGYQFHEVIDHAGRTVLLVTKNSTNELTGRRVVKLSPTLLLEV